MEERPGLEEMIGHLLQVGDEAWGRYAFSRDLLNRRVPPLQKPEMIRKAIACGKAYAQKMVRDCGTRDIRAIAEHLKLQVDYRDTSITGNRILFARFTPPDQVEIMKEPVAKAVLKVSEEAPKLVELFRHDDIIDTVLGHEMYHAVEEAFEQEIYTRTEKIQLWSILGLKNLSTVRALSEIGAMAFTRELNGLPFSPFILDVLLYDPYDSSSARKIYEDILKCVWESEESR